MANWKDRISKAKGTVSTSLRRIQPVTEVVSKAAQVALTARSGGLAAVAGIGTVVVNEIGRHVHMGSWEPLYSTSLGGFLSYALHDLSVYREDDIEIFRLPSGIEVMSRPPRIMCSKGLAAAARAEIQPYLEACTPKWCKLSIKKDESTVRFTEYEPQLLHSEIAARQALRIRKLQAVKPHRSLLIQGRPGAGKTCAAAYIAHRLYPDGRITFLDPAAWENVPALAHLFRILPIDVLILDDVDRFTRRDTLLSFLDPPRSIPLIIGTSNYALLDYDRDAPGLSPAQSRPGRFDEVLPMNSISEVPERRTPFDQLSDADWERVKEFPEAYLQELAVRIEAFGSQGELGIDLLETRLQQKRTDRRGRREIVEGPMPCSEELKFQA